MQVENQNAARVAPGFGGATANIRYRLFEQHFRRRGDKHALGVPGGKLLPAARRPGLIEHRRALRRRFAEVDPRHGEEVTLMIDRMNFLRIAEDPALAIAQHRAIFPAPFQQLINHVEILIGVVIARIVIGLRLMANVARPAFQIRGDDVPAHPALGQMIEG